MIGVTGPGRDGSCQVSVVWDWEPTGVPRGNSYYTWDDNARSYAIEIVPAKPTAEKLEVCGWMMPTWHATCASCMCVVDISTCV